MTVCPSCGLPAPHNGPCPNSHTLVGTKVLQDRYEIVDLLGQGRMGTVYMARDLRLDGRACVVKKLRDDFYRHEDRQKAEQFFAREAKVLSKLQHPNIVHILDAFTEGSSHYLVMEYVKGSDLHHILAHDRGGTPFDEDKQVIPWAIQICDVLKELHTETIIYRDLKPSNIMIDIKGQIKLVDFGIARTWEENNENTHVVSAGYSPPEQYWGQASPQSDIYSLGATMHFLLTGKDPEALHLSSPKTLNAHVSEYTDALIQKATAQDLNERFQTVDELREALLQKDYVTAPETTRSRVGEIVVGILLFIVAAVLYLGPLTLEPSAKNTAKNQEDNLKGLPDQPREQPSVTVRTTVSGKETSTTTNQEANQQDLAVQDMEEKDLTDPAGLEQTSTLFRMPWTNDKPKN